MDSLIFKGRSVTKNQQVCTNISAATNTVGGLFCSKYQWNKEECGTATQVSEVTSKYILIYEVTNQRCDFDATNLQGNESCLNNHSYPGAICESGGAVSDAITLGCSPALMALAGVYFQEV